VRIKVPEGHYLILPSTLTYTVHGNITLPPGLWQELACVPAGRIEGAAYLRLQPLRRLERIR
jgi:hypothetical protein